MTESIPTMERPDYAIARNEMRELLDSLGVTVECEFVPLSQSRNAGEKHPTVNWRATVQRETARLGGARILRDVLTCDYSQGVAHLKGYDQMQREGWLRSVDGADAIKSACEYHQPRDPRIHAVAPTREDILGSLATDSDVIDYATYDDWAPNLGYDPDSRKGEAIYRACLETALKLRAAIGDEKLRELCELASRF